MFLGSNLTRVHFNIYLLTFCQIGVIKKKADLETEDINMSQYKSEVIRCEPIPQISNITEFSFFVRSHCRIIKRAKDSEDGTGT